MGLRLPVVLALAIISAVVGGILFYQTGALSSFSAVVHAVPGDADDDGIPDGSDLCPNNAEDFDGVQDTDGCPDSDASVPSLSFPSPADVATGFPTPIVVDFDISNGNYPGDLHVLLQVTLPADCPTTWVAEPGDEVSPPLSAGSNVIGISEFDLLAVSADTTVNLSRTMQPDCAIDGSYIGSVLAAVTTQGDTAAPNPVMEENTSDNFLSNPLTVNAAPSPDSDGDGVPDILDNCPNTPNPGQENDVHSGTPAGDHCEDPEPDGVFDIDDNCPDTSNPLQTNTDVDLNTEGVTIYGVTVPADAMGNDCDVEDDNDSPSIFPNDWTDAIESFLLTDPLEACPRTIGVHDAWPPDVDMSRNVNILDMNPLKNAWQAASGDPDYNQRVDFDTSGNINILDFNKFKHGWQKNCTVP